MPLPYKPPPYKPPTIKVEDYQLSEAYPPDKGSSYPFPPEEDLWIHSHNAIRCEMHFLREALEALVEHLVKESDGTQLEDWTMVVDCIQVVWDAHFQYLKTHHFHEDETVGSVAKQRFRWPEDVTSTHEDLERLLQRIDEKIKALQMVHRDPADKSGALDATKNLLRVWIEYQQVCLEHLDFEEANLLPLVRAYLSHGDMTRLIFQILRNVPKSELGAIIHCTGEHHIRTQSLKYQSVPDFLWPFIFQPAVDHYRSTVIASMEAIRTGIPPPEHDKEAGVCAKLCQWIRKPFFAVAQLFAVQKDRSKKAD